jgi:hypothetical protein
MISVVVASTLASQCFADSCILRYLAIASSAGAIIGVAVGIRYAYTIAATQSGPVYPPTTHL